MLREKQNAQRAFKIAFFLLFLSTVMYSACSAEVKITGQKGNWQLIVDEKPFYIKGAACGLAEGKNGEDYLKLAQELGANCVRTWGIDQGTKEYLDAAWSYGLMVDAGIWLNWSARNAEISYIGDTSYKKKAWKVTLDYIKRFKGHPAVLMWNVGNEVLFFSKSEEEKIAFCNFLELLIREIHKIDPMHPVIYASAAFLNLSYLKKYVPSLDAVGMNSYGSIRTIHSNWDFLGFTIPYVITEYGPYLPSDSRRDENKQAVELGDYPKSRIYRDYAQQIQGFKGYNLGGFVFHLGETTQESMTWWNINEGDLKRQSYWEIYQIYTGKVAPYNAPRIRRMTLSKTKNLKANEIIDVEVLMRDEKTDGLSFTYRMSTTYEGVLQYYVNQYIPIKVTGTGNKVKIKVPNEPGVYRLYCFVQDTHGNISSVNKTVSVETPTQ